VLDWIYANADIIIRLGLLGALVGASVSFGLREYFDWRRRARERRGLLTMMDLETEGHERQLMAFEQHPDWVTRAPAHSLGSKIWEESRARLSQLLNKKEEFVDLLKYYEGIRVIDGVRSGAGDVEAVRGFGPDYRLEEKKTAVARHKIEKGLPQLREQCEKARMVIRKYVPEDALDGTPLKNITFDRYPE
jgi:hypothetical protein